MSNLSKQEYVSEIVDLFDRINLLAPKPGDTFETVRENQAKLDSLISNFREFHLRAGTTIVA